MSKFYDDLAADYDVLTGTAMRAAAVRRFVAELQRRHGFGSALDAACGTGVFTRALAGHARPVWGADLSAQMLRRARQDSEGAAAHIRWIERPMQDLQGCLDQKVDLILCMGNSLPHLLTREELRSALRGFAALLTAGGTLVLHQINYDRLLTSQERLVGVTRSENSHFLRFYDLQGERLLFNVVATHWSAAGQDTTWHSTALRPHRSREITDTLRDCGFEPPEMYADLNFTPFEQDRSDLLVLQARKPPAG